MDRHDPHWEERLRAGPAEADALLASMRPLVSHVLVRPFVEAYRIVADVLADDGTLTDSGEVIRRALGLGRQYVAQRRLRSSEAVSALLFQTAFQLVSNRGLIGGSGGEDLAARQAAFLDELRNLLRRLDRIEDLVIRRYIRDAVRTRPAQLPRDPARSADVGREVLTGEGGAVGDDVSRGAFEDDPAAIVASAGAEVDNPVGVRHDRLVMLDDDHRLTRVDQPVKQFEQLLDVGEVQAGGRLVQDVDAAQVGHVGGQLEPLPLAAGQRGERLADGEVAEPDVGEPAEDGVRGRRVRLAGAEELTRLSH
jgi:hypothetical protein